MTDKGKSDFLRMHQKLGIRIFHALALLSIFEMGKDIISFIEEILDALPLGIVVVGAEGKVRIWNRWVEELTGKSKNQQVGKELPENFNTGGLPLCGKVREALSTKTPFYSYDCFFVGDKEKTIYSSGRVIKEGSKDVAGLVIILDEGNTKEAGLSEEAKKYQERLEKKAIKLEEMARERSEFLSTISHELKTPLNSIIGFSEILKEETFGKVNEKQARYLANIYQSGMHLFLLINDILDLSRMESGELALYYSEFLLSKVIESIQTLVKSQAVKKDITLKIEVDERITTIRADQARVKKIIYSLVDNAIKFTPSSGKVEITCRPSGDHFIEISVADTGIGIKPEDREHVFEDFQQIDGLLSREYEGIGLGLALTKRLVELHGGRIWVENGNNKGSKFTFTIPAR